MGEMRIDTSAAAAGVQKIDGMFQGLLESLGFMVEKMEELVALMAPQEQSFFAGLIGGTDVFNTLADGRTNLEGIFEAVNQGMEAVGKKGESFNIFKALVPEMQGFTETLMDGFNAVVAVPFNGINFPLGLVHVPQIPKLAQGAVLPANRPFLAVVGDQRKGTNVEAPLGVIQEAVALELAGLVQSNLAGHEATVAVLRQILEAVLGIDIGDDVIGRAAGRYNAAMAVMRGGRS